MSETVQKSGIEYRIHDTVKPWSIHDLEKETRFADLLVISEELFFRNWGGEQPNHFLRQLLTYTECPAIVIPENYSLIEKLLLAYDGKCEALFALKSFAYLFPRLCNLETMIIYVKKEENESIPDLEYLEEFAVRHFPNLTIEKLHFDASKYLTDWISINKNAILITGSFGRSYLTNLVKQSFVQKIIKEHSLPLFIAHK